MSLMVKEHERDEENETDEDRELFERLQEHYQILKQQESVVKLR